MIIQVPADTTYPQEIEELFYIQTEAAADVRLLIPRKGVNLQLSEVDLPRPQKRAYGEAWTYHTSKTRGALVVWLTPGTHKIVNLTQDEDWGPIPERRSRHN